MPHSARYGTIFCSILALFSFLAVDALVLSFPMVSDIILECLNVRYDSENHVGVSSSNRLSSLFNSCIVDTTCDSLNLEAIEYALKRWESDIEPPQTWPFVSYMWHWR